ncbi:hypothetical protein LUZ60_002372 [Juncus effusus]|nr:hypothetical protein LUZ60_002372 [Juncus effusus]
MTESKKHHHTSITNPKPPLPKQLDETLCPICMDHPHNSVRLICSSNCNCYICDTSYRHSNCLDRFKKPLTQNDQNTPEEKTNSSLKCPLCRGEVLGWTVVEEARKYLDQKVKCCSRESCGFLGNYKELRHHARRNHPLTRPGLVDPSRLRTWNRMERRQEYGDVLSAIRSAMPGAVVFGDYVIEMGGEETSRRRGRGEEADRGGPGPWWTPFVLFQTSSRSPSRREQEEEERRVRRRRRRYGR